jgi:hypothetical protein
LKCRAFIDRARDTESQLVNFQKRNHVASFPGEISNDENELHAVNVLSPKGMTVESSSSLLLSTMRRAAESRNLMGLLVPKRQKFLIIITSGIFLAYTNERVLFDMLINQYCICSFLDKRAINVRPTGPQMHYNGRQTCFLKTSVNVHAYED